MNSVFLKDEKWQKEFFCMAIKDFLEKKENNFIDYKYIVLEDIDNLLDFVVEKGEKQI